MNDQIPSLVVTTELSPGKIKMRKLAYRSVNHEKNGNYWGDFDRPDGSQSLQSVPNNRTMAV
jgi:hypothetical protein